MKSVVAEDPIEAIRERVDRFFDFVELELHASHMSLDISRSMVTTPGGLTFRGQLAAISDRVRQDYEDLVVAVSVGPATFWRSSSGGPAWPLLDDDAVAYLEIERGDGKSILALSPRRLASEGLAPSIDALQKFLDEAKELIETRRELIRSLLATPYIPNDPDE
ncbi:MAG: hypothetical protein QOK28_1258 [Actinomycetota bacterium]|jgi:hypothetical protein